MRKTFIIILILVSVLFSGCFQKTAIGISNDFNQTVNLEGGNLPVAIQDQFTQIVDLKLTVFIDNLTLLDNYSIGDTKINVSTLNNVTPQLDDIICLKEEQFFYQGHVINVTFLGGTSYEVELDRPLDYPYTTVGGCSLRDGNWAVDGSTTPKIYYVSPGRLVNTSWDITRVIFTCIGDGISGPDAQPDITSFMVTDGPLTKGIVFRITDGETKNIFSAIDNFHLVSEAYDLTFYDASRFGLYAATVRRSFGGPDKNGVTIRLDSETYDRFELIIQDDLTDMTDCHAVAQGHVVKR